MDWLSSLIKTPPVETNEPKIYLYLPNYPGIIKPEKTPVTVDSAETLLAQIANQQFNIVYKLKNSDNLIDIVKQINKKPTASVFELIVLGNHASKEYYEQLCRYKQEFKSIKFYNNNDRTVTSECVTESIKNSQATLLKKMETDPTISKEVVIVGIDSPLEAIYTITALEEAMKKGYAPIYFKETMNDELKAEIKKLVTSKGYALLNEAEKKRKQQQQRQQRQKANQQRLKKEQKQYTQRMIAQQAARKTKPAEQAARKTKQAEQAERAEQAARKTKQAKEQEAQLTKAEFNPENWAMRTIEKKEKIFFKQMRTFEKMVIYPKKLNGKKLGLGRLVKYKPDPTNPLEYYYYIQDYDDKNSLITFEREWTGNKFSGYIPQLMIPENLIKKMKAITSSNFLVPKEIATSIV